MKVLWVRPVAELEQRERALAGLNPILSFEKQSIKSN
jgi:hypothetical protein